MNLIDIREFIEENERKNFSKYAMLSSESKGRTKLESQCSIRTCFQRDRDRIIHSNAFRRLKHKTQVFLSPKGDHYRTRLTHTLEVSQIARTIARALRLNEDLTESIALAHDLGHAPFGHAGERALNSIMTCGFKDSNLNNLLNHSTSINGNFKYGFKHHLQSVRVVELLEKNLNGLNLTHEVKNGIVCHTSGSPKAKTLEGQIVEYSDKIAYLNHDIEDAVRAKILSERDLPKECKEILGGSKNQRINTTINNIIFSSMDKNIICMGNDVKYAISKLRNFMFENVYTNSAAKIDECKVENIIYFLFYHYYSNRDEIPKSYSPLIEKYGLERSICDYIAGMTDSYSVMLYSNISIPRCWDFKNTI